MIWAITPIKSFKRPKSRLGDVLNLEERRVLVKYMLKKILLSQKKSKLFNEYLVVTEDKDVVKYVKELGFNSLLQKKPGLNQGITEASLKAKKSGAKTILILHGDVPRTDASVLKSVSKKHKTLIKEFKKGVTMYYFLFLLRDTKGYNANTASVPGAGYTPVVILSAAELKSPTDSIHSTIESSTSFPNMAPMLTAIMVRTNIFLSSFLIFVSFALFFRLHSCKSLLSCCVSLD